MYKEVGPTQISGDLLEQLEKGAFLTVKAGDKVNTMTIAWGSLGCIWYKPVFIVMVRYSRHTYQLMEKAKDFTVSFPLRGQLREALGIAGSISGRDTDKFKECNLHLKEGMAVHSPVIDGCDLYLECKIIYKQPMVPENLCGVIKQEKYPQGDYHVFYFGEIVKAYIKE